MKKLIAKLLKLEGKWYMHLGHKIHVMHVVDDGDSAIVITNKKKYPLRTEDEAHNFLDGLIDTVSDQEEDAMEDRHKINEGAMVVMTNETQKSMTLLTDITTILKDNITKVATDEKYIKQAAQINKSATQIISIAKLNLEVAKQMAKLK